VANANIRAAIQAFDWETYVDSHYSAQRVHGSHGLELRINCPHPECGDHKNKCYVNPDKGYFHCFLCDFKSSNYNLFDFISFTEDVTPAVAMFRVMQSYTPTTPTDDDFAALIEPPDAIIEDTDRPRYLNKLPDECLRLTQLPHDSPAITYALSRGLQRDEWLAANLHYTDEWSPVEDAGGHYKGNLRHRLIIPLYHDRKLCGWQARATQPNDIPKYLNCPDSDMAKTLWPAVPPITGQQVVLVEGVFDALAVRKAGYSAYAVFSKKISPPQLRLLKGWGITDVILWFDKKDALPEMVKAVEKLKMIFDKVSVPSLQEWPKDKDTGDMLLSGEHGSDIIRDTLSKCIDVYNTQEYTPWTLGFC